MKRYFLSSKKFLIVTVVFLFGLTCFVNAENFSAPIVPPSLKENRSSSEGKPKGEPAETPSLDLIIPDNAKETPSQVEGGLSIIPESSDKNTK